MTAEQQWVYCDPPETGESNACVHPITESYGVEGVYCDQHEREPTFRWLSNVDECKWGGVRCENGRLTSHLRLGKWRRADCFLDKIGLIAIPHAAFLFVFSLSYSR